MSEATAAAAPAAPAEVTEASAAPVEGDAGLTIEGGDAGERPAEAPAEGERFTLKVNGEEVELTRDEVLARAQKAEGVERRFEEVAKLRKEAEAALRDPLAFMEQGLGAEKAHAMILDRMLSNPQTLDVVAQRMLELFEYQDKSPEERQKIDRDRELERKAKRADEYEEQERQRQHAQQVEQQTARLSQQFGAALSKHGLEGNARAMSDLSFYVEQALDSKANVTLDQLAAKVAERYQGNRSASLEELAGLDDDEALYNSIPAATLKRIRAAEARRQKGRVASTIERVPAGKAAPAPKPANDGPRASEDFWKKLRGG